MQGDVERVGESLVAVKLELNRVREEASYDKKKVDSLSSEIVLHQKKNQQLTRDLDNTQKEVGFINTSTSHLLLSPPQLIQMKQAAAEARGSFTHSMNMLRTAHSEEKESWRIENNALRHEHSAAKLVSQC